MFCTAEDFPKGTFASYFKLLITSFHVSVFCVCFCTSVFIWLRFFVAKFGDRIHVHDCMYVSVGEVTMVLEHV